MTAVTTAPTLAVEVAAPGACAGLVESLAARGLRGTMADEGDRCVLRVAYAVDPAERLHREVRDALEGWLSDRDLPLVLAAGEGDGYVLRPAAD